MWSHTGQPPFTTMNKIHSIGFTGTSQAGAITVAQRESLSILVHHLYLAYQFKEAHHGDCVEADKIFDGVVKDFCGISRMIEINIIQHPGNNLQKRAWCKVRSGIDTRLPVWPSLIRNRHIVAASNLLIACPMQDSEVLRSGTWATVRKARKKQLPIFMVWPTGNIQMDQDLHLEYFNEVFANYPIVCSFLHDLGAEIL